MIRHPELVGLSLAPLLVGATMLANGVARWRRWRVGPDWVRVRARVTVATELVGSDLLGPSTLVYRYPYITYEYRVGEAVYTGQLSQGLVGRAGRALRRGVRVGAPIDIRYDPRAPDRSGPVGHVEWSAPVSLAAGVALLSLAGWVAWRATRP